MILIMIQKKYKYRFSNPQSLFSSSAAVIKAKEGHIKEKFTNSHLTSIFWDLMDPSVYQITTDNISIVPPTLFISVQYIITSILFVIQHK